MQTVDLLFEAYNHSTKLGELFIGGVVMGDPAVESYIEDAQLAKQESEGWPDSTEWVEA